IDASVPGPRWLLPPTDAAGSPQGQIWDVGIADDEPGAFQLSWRQDVGLQQLVERGTSNQFERTGEEHMA
ncbi:hypothetical protein, partial [Escherichia coli]|uniref:hypothetical protein n=1 Tax=Escherichia coli TaxID=562 RepID=UPI00202717A0